MLSGFEAIQAALRSSATPDFRWQADITSDADHGSNPELSFPLAANWYWARWQGGAARRQAQRAREHEGRPDTLR